MRILKGEQGLHAYRRPVFKAYYCIDRMGLGWQAAYVSFNLRFHRFGKFIGRAFKTARHVTLVDRISVCVSKICYHPVRAA